MNSTFLLQNSGKIHISKEIKLLNENKASTTIFSRKKNRKIEVEKNWCHDKIFFNSWIFQRLTKLEVIQDIHQKP